MTTRFVNALVSLLGGLSGGGTWADPPASHSASAGNPAGETLAASSLDESVCRYFSVNVHENKAKQVAEVDFGSCTGTFIGPGRFQIAAHCFAYKTNGDSVLVCGGAKPTTYALSREDILPSLVKPVAKYLATRDAADDYVVLPVKNLRNPNWIPLATDAELPELLDNDKCIFVSGSGRFAFVYQAMVNNTPADKLVAKPDDLKPFRSVAVSLKATARLSARYCEREPTRKKTKILSKPGAMLLASNPADPSKPLSVAGDSGGPLVCYTREGKARVVGALTGDISCAAKGKAFRMSTFTRP